MVPTLITQVYMLRHNVTGRMYIGRSMNIPKRIQHHFTMLHAGKHPVEDMQDDFDRYGDSYTVSVLGEVNNANLRLEIEMMDKYQSTVRGVGYNYKDPHVTSAVRNRNRKRSSKQVLRNLIETLDDSQAIYAYTFLSKMFGKEDVHENTKRN